MSATNNKVMSDPLPKSNIINLKEEMPGVDTNFVSDGYHTFYELYEHRIVLYMALAKSKEFTNNVWMSKAHSDGSIWDGWFILGINEAHGEQITYHLPMSKWDECAIFAFEREKAPNWDGHTSDDVLDRISKL